MAVNHGLTDYAESIRKSIPDIVEEMTYSKTATALIPPKPLVQDYAQASEIMNGWPVFEVSEEKAAFANLESQEELDDQIVAGLDEDDEEENDEAQNLDGGQDMADIAQMGMDNTQTAENWGLDMDLGDDLDLDSDEIDQNPNQDNTGSEIKIFIEKEDPIVVNTKKNSIIAGELVSIGEFELAIEKLRSQIGLKNTQEIKKMFYNVYISSQYFQSTMDFLPPRASYITKNQKDKLSPFVSVSLKSLEKDLKKAYQLTTAAKFQEAIVEFRTIILQATLLSLESKQEMKMAEKFISICTEYIIALSCDVEKKKTVILYLILEKYSKSCRVDCYYGIDESSTCS